MAWGILTNGLMDLCRVSLETFGTNSGARGATRPAAETKAREGENSSARKPRMNDELMRAMGGGFLWMMDMFGNLQTVPTVADVWEKAQCAIRWPSAWSIIKIPVKGIAIALIPRPEKVTLASTAAAEHAGPLYRLPVDLECDQRNLSHVEIIVGPARGAEMLMAGIRSIRARHPTKPKQEFFTQVLASGTVPEEK